jgi:hypothetical protein
MFCFRHVIVNTLRKCDDDVDDDDNDDDDDDNNNNNNNTLSQIYNELHLLTPVFLQCAAHYN